MAIYMTSNGHLCLAFFAKDSWKDNFRERFYTETNSKFISVLKATYDTHDAWAEVHVQNLFNPESPEGKEKICFVGEYLLSLFREKMGGNNGLILFSHTVPKHKSIASLLGKFIQDDRVKKIFFTVLDEDSYVEPTKSRRDEYSERINDMYQTTLHISEFQQRIMENGYEYDSLFEIVKFKFY